jgi:hypothetical protein
MIPVAEKFVCSLLVVNLIDLFFQIFVYAKVEGHAALCSCISLTLAHITYGILVATNFLSNSVALL